MKESSTSLEQLHDIILPESISWWPMAPGWNLLLFIVACCAFYGIVTVRRRWKANAYRRIALKELQAATSILAVSEILRRTALTFTPRSTLAVQTGPDWPDWLCKTASLSLHPQVAEQLSLGAYQVDADKPQDIRELKQFARQWILSHRAIELPNDRNRSSE